MNLSFFIARRYFLSRKKKNFINVISIISMALVTVGTMTLVIVLSVFNGLENLLTTLYGSFDAPIQITSTNGKSFEVSEQLLGKVLDVKGVESITEVIEDNVLVKYNESQSVFRMKGVSDNFIEQGRMKEALVEGSLDFYKENKIHAIIGRGVQYQLGISLRNEFYSLQTHYPDNIRPGLTDPSKLFSVQYILPGGIFAIEKNYDENYIIVPLKYAESLFNYKGKRTSLELDIKDNYSVGTLKNNLKTTLGDEFQIKDNKEQHADFYKILNIEKLVVTIIFVLVLAIGSINIFFSLTMLVIDKKRDIAVLYTQGATNGLIRNIFIAEGSIIALSGALLGISLGLAITYLQDTFGFVSMGMETAVVDAYPVKIEVFDILITSVIVVVITIFSSWKPAIAASKEFDLQQL